MKKLIEYAESANIAELLEEVVLNKIGEDVISGFDADVESRSQWQEKQNDSMCLAAQVVEGKSFPWPEAANVKYPLLTEAAIQFNSRIYPALIPSTDLVKARPVGYDATGEKINQATRISKHMTWQLSEEMEDWEEEMDRALLALPITGCFFKKTYFDEEKEVNASECISAFDFVVDYYSKSIETAFRKTHVLYYREDEYRRGVRAGIYLDLELGAPVYVERHPTAKEDHKENRQDASTPYQFVEQHTYLDLDDDGVLEPYIITCEHSSRKVVRITAGFDIDDVLLNSKQEIIEVPQKQFFTKYGFIPNPDGGIYDIGFGQLLSPINKTVDTLINMLLDSGALSNLQSGFLAKGFRSKSGAYRFKPGEWKQVNVRGDDIRKNVYPMPVREPSGVLFQLLGLMIDSGQRLASTIDSMVGENPGQNQKATTTLAVIEQGQKVFNGIYKRLHRSFKKELKKLFVLNAENLPAESYLNILDLPVDAKQAEVIRRTDYNIESFNVVPAADSSIATQQQKLVKAQALLELLPMGTINPQVVTQRVLEAQEQPNIEMLMKVQPPQEDPEIAIKRMQAMDESERAWAEFDLKVLEAMQNDLKVQAEAILAIAKAEAEEDGMQIQMYTAQMNSLQQKSQTIAKKAEEIGDKRKQRRNGGVENTTSN